MFGSARSSYTMFTNRERHRANTTLPEVNTVKPNQNGDRNGLVVCSVVRLFASLYVEGCDEFAGYQRERHQGS